MQALRCAHHCADLRAGPHRSGAPGLPGTGPGAPGLVLRMPQSQDQYGGESQHHPGEPLLSSTSTRTTPPALGCRPWSASCRNGTPSAPARASTCAAAGRTGWPTLASPFLSSVPSTASCPPGRGSLRISPTWTCPSTAAEGFWTGCPMWAGDGTPSPLVRRCWTPGWRSGATFAGAWRPRRMWTNAGWSRRCRRWKRPGRKGRNTWPSSPSMTLVGLFARNLDLVYSMRTSNHQVDGKGCSWRQTFTDAAGRMHWDHVFVTELLSNSSYRPVHDFIMGAEYTAVARVRRALAEVPKHYLKCLKTDCLVMQDVPKKHRSAIERLLRLSHRDGTPVYRCEPTEGLRGQCREPRMEAEPIKEKPAWRRVEDPLTHCLGGESLLLTGYPGTGKTHLARKIVEAQLVRRNVRSGRCSATWLVIEELTQLDTPLWADIACLSMNTSMRFLLLGDFRQLPAVLDSFAGAEVCRELKDSQLLHDLAGGWCHELSERWRFDEGVFSFLQWLRVAGRAGASARSRADGPAALPAERRAGGLPGHLPRQATANQRARESQASAGACAAGAVRRAGDGGNQCAPNHEGVAGPAARGRRRQSAEGRLRHCQRSGRASVAGKRAELRASGAAEAHPPLQRHHLRFRAGPDPPGPGLALRRGLSPLHHEAPLHGVLQGDQQRTFERFVTCCKVH